MAKDIGTSTKSFNEYIKKHDTTQPERVISVNELKDAFFSLKINQSAGYDGMSFNVVKKCFGVLHKPLLHLFNLSLQTGVFPGKIKIARVTPLFKGSENYELGNYRLISVYLCYHVSQKFWTKLCIIVFTSILLTVARSTKSSLVFRKDIPLNIQLVDQIRNSFESKPYTLDVFVDLSKAFVTVNHKF